jgi:hypothetical protein
MTVAAETRFERIPKVVRTNRQVPNVLVRKSDRAPLCLPSAGSLHRRSRRRANHERHQHNARQAFSASVKAPRRTRRAAAAETARAAKAKKVAKRKAVAKKSDKMPSTASRILAESLGIVVRWRVNVHKPTATHCQGGGRASVMAFGLELMGATDVSNYYKSFGEWGNADDTPVVPGKPK